MKEDKNIDIHDAFSEQISQKLAKHTMPVDDAVWKGIQQRMAPQKRIIPWWAYTAVAAAAAILLLFTIGDFMRQPQGDTFHEVTLSNNATIRTDQAPMEQSANQELLSTNDVMKSTIADKLIASSSVKLTSKSTKHQPLREVVWVESSDPQISDTIESTNDRTIASTLIVPTDGKEKHSPSIASTNNETAENKNATSNTLNEKLQVLEADWTDVIKKKDTRDLMLAASYGSGIASSSVTIPGRSRAYRHQSLVDMKTNYNKVLTPNDFNKKHYLPPVTVGISVRLPLYKPFSIESGLVYTYLTTRLSGTTNAEITAESNLHYLGVPLNLITTLINEKRWEIYISTGATVEKGLRSEFKQYQDFGNKLFSTTGNSSVDGLQWSLNASLGVAYHLNQHLSLFLDPKLSYYFENDQPFSIRSDMPTLIGLNTGLRMTL